MTAVDQQLPEGWIECKLPDANLIIMGQSPPGDTYNKNESGLPFFQGKAEFGEKYPTAKKWCSAPSKIAKPNDILLSIRAPVGPTNMANQECAIGRGLAIIRPLDGIPSDFVFFWLRYIEKEITDQGIGSTFSAINSSHISGINLLLPPLPEQKRIVAKLNNLLPHVLNVSQRLDRVTGILKRFRQSVFAAAVSGKLTEDWREGNVNTPAIKYSSILNLELPLGWNVEKIHNFTSKVGSGATPKGGKSSYKTKGIPFIRSQNIHFDGFKDEGLVFLDNKQAKELKNVIVNPDDVLLNITGASIGRVTLAPKRMRDARVNQHVCIIRPVKLICPAFLSYFLASPFMQEFIMNTQYGVTRQALTKGQILDFDIPVPSEPEQKEIVRRVEALFAFADKVEARIKAVQAKTDKLPQSILNKAFIGQLIPTEAELARQENRPYEAAENLLKRIEQEKQSNNNLKKRFKGDTMYIEKKKKKKKKKPDIKKLPISSDSTVSEIHDAYDKISQ